jgi:hypothetical protein
MAWVASTISFTVLIALAAEFVGIASALPA